jgi:ABC-2 type transport system permease protein
VPPHFYWLLQVNRNAKLADMQRTLKTYPVLLRAYFARALEYRFQALLWLLWGASPLVMLAVWLTMVQDGPIRGYDANAFIGYYLGITWMRRVTYLWVLDMIEQRIRSGELSAYLLRPLNMAHHLLAHAIAYHLVQAVVTGIVIGGIALLVPGQQFDLHPLNLLLFTLAVSVGFLFEFLVQYIVGALAFWTTQVANIFGAVFYIKTLLGGFVVPMALFPPPLRDVLRWLPFQSSVALPVEILIGRMAPTQALLGIGVSAAWVVLMAFGATFIWRSGLRSYSAVGA